MSALLFYLLKASITLAGLYLVFWLFLRKDTFHHLKRFALLANLLLSLLLPLLNIDLSGLTRESAEHTPLPQETIVVSQFVLAATPLVISAKASTIPWIEIAGFLYLPVLLVLLTRFIIQLFSVYQLIRKARVIKRRPLIMATSTKINSPFSFFRYLILNPELYEPDTLLQIIQHEQVHINGHHTIDRLISEVYTILFWFNPFAWLHQNLVKLNLEYMADQSVLNAGFSAESYQSNLLRLILPESDFRLTNNFNQSGLLKRIHMMNRPASPFTFRLKIAFIIPTLTGLIAIFNGTQAKKAENMLQAFAPSKQRLALTQAQSRTITGIIQDADMNKPLSGVLIQVKGQSTSTQSDASGKFSIDVTEKDKALVFQLEYFNTAEMAITPQSEMTVLLKFTDRQVYPSVMTYFSDSTYIVKPGEILESRWSSAWKYNGWSIDIERSQDNLPGDVLYLIDGKEIDKTSLNKIDKNLIESITVYKDRISLRKYNAEDKRGVVEIKLKK